eukprot:2519835-Pleurochrysis_carterae.AAC.2
MSKISHAGGRLICQEGPNSGNNNETIPIFTRAECNEARANTNSSGGKRMPAVQSIPPTLTNVRRIRWVKRIFAMPIF